MNKLALTLCLSGISLISCSEFEGGTSKTMQEDFDKIRMDQITYMFEMINDYYTKKGSYPFSEESDSIPAVVVFETEQQARGHKGKYPIFVDLNTRFSSPDSMVQPARINRKEVHEFYQELHNVLNKEPEIIKDPQKVPMRKPCIYTYVIYKGVFDITAFLHNQHSFLRPLSPYNSKFTLTSSSRSFPSAGIWNEKDIQANKDFQFVMAEPFNRGGYTFKSKIAASLVH